MEAPLLCKPNRAALLRGRDFLLVSRALKPCSKLADRVNRCPGMYNALSGLGGGGQIDAKVNDNATVALYSTFAVVAFFSGTVCNKLGVRITLTMGCFR